MSATATSGRRSALRIGGLDGLLFAGLFVTIAASGVVMAEPAPYDGLIVALMAAAVVAGLRIDRRLGPLFLLTALTVAGDAIGSALANDVAYSTQHSLVTLYLAASAVFFACLVAAAPDRTLAALVPAQVLAALLTSAAGIAGVLALHPLATELFTEFGRARGAFKDPNVMAPFLILPVMFAVHRLMTRPLVRTLHWLPVLAVLLMAVFLSFSRGAWIHLIISGAVYMGLLLLTAPDGASRRRAIGVSLAGIAVVAIAIAVLAGVDGIGGLFEQRAALTQAYDTGESGRFAGQLQALELATENPLGLGAGDFAVYHGEQVHNVYLNAFVNGGWLGGFAYLALVVATLVAGLNAALRRSPWQGAATVAIATFAGVAVEGLVVDTDHWRHFHLLVGLVWGLAAASRPPDRVPRAPPKTGPTRSAEA